MNENYLGLGSRLKKAPAAALARSAFARELKAAPLLLKGLSYADMAHVACLMQCKVITEDKCRKILAGLFELHDLDFEDYELDPFLGDIYDNRDELLRHRLGDLSGIIHTGRARREATTIAWQIACRERLVELVKNVCELGFVLLGLVKEHRKTYMTDFTYLQHAHPTTLSHYLLGFLYPLSRDLKRLKCVLALVNRSPAGSGSVNGSQIPMDREYLASLLGFDGLIEHTRDAMWAPDMAIEMSAVMMSLFTTLDRFAEELQLWSTEEFGFVRLDDSHTRTSVIMPQKKNPYGLTYLRGEARSMLGRLVAVVSTNLTVTGQPDNRITAYEDLPEGLEWANRGVCLLADILAKCEFDIKRLQASAKTGYAYATDICDFLICETGLDNRTIHRIVGCAVRNCLEGGVDVIMPAHIREAANELGITISTFDDKKFMNNQKIEYIIAARKGRGGAGNGPMQRMIEDLGRDFHDAQDFERHPLNRFEKEFLSQINALF